MQHSQGFQALVNDAKSRIAQIDIDGYRKSPDSLAGRGGLRIRDEIRMVRPGLYLGRAYANRAFLLNFTLFNAAVAERDGPAFARGEAVAEDCWPGEQRRTTAVR